MSLYFYIFSERLAIKMPKSLELNQLKSEVKDAFLRKQEAFEDYVYARDRTNDAYNAMQSAWKELNFARDRMNHEYDVISYSSEDYRKIWGEYNKIRDANNTRIESLRREADAEHQMMRDSFGRASNAYYCGDRTRALEYSSEGHAHKERRNKLNREISSLVFEIRNAKANAEKRAPRTDNATFRKTKELFEVAKENHTSAMTLFKRLKGERNHYKAKFDAAQEEYLRLKEELQVKLAETKAKNEGIKSF